MNPHTTTSYSAPLSRFAGRLTTTKWSIMSALVTGELRGSDGGHEVTHRIRAVEREDGSGKSFNVTLLDGRTLYVRTSD